MSAGFDDGYHGLGCNPPDGSSRERDRYLDDFDQGVRVRREDEQRARDNARGLSYAIDVIKAEPPE